MRDRPNIHPGEIIQEEYLDELGMSAYQLAKGLGVQQTAVSEILKGRRGISPIMALRLGRFFRTSPQFWLNLQATYDLRETEAKMGDKLAEIEPCASVPA